MDWLTKALKKVLGNEPPPQYGDLDTEEFEVVEGRHGAQKSLLWSEDNEALFTESKPGAVQVTGSNADDDESITVDNTVGGVGLTGATYGTSRYALITAETAQMRFTVSGNAPTTTHGHLLNPGDTIYLDSLADITAFRAIRTGSVSGVLQVSYSGVA